MDARVKPAHDVEYLPSMWIAAPASWPSLPGLTRQSMRHRKWSVARILDLRLIMDARVKPAHDVEYLPSMWIAAPAFWPSLPGLTRQSMRHRR
jgi:hypothetical protein